MIGRRSKAGGANRDRPLSGRPAYQRHLKAGREGNGGCCSHLKLGQKILFFYRSAPPYCILATVSQCGIVAAGNRTTKFQSGASYRSSSRPPPPREPISRAEITPAEERQAVPFSKMAAGASLRWANGGRLRLRLPWRHFRETAGKASRKRRQKRRLHVGRRAKRPSGRGWRGARRPWRWPWRWPGGRPPPPPGRR